MPCEVRGNAIICSRRSAPKRCEFCGRPGGKLCDYKLTGAKEGKTCDRSLCAKCAVHVHPDTDYCPTHARMLGVEA